MFSKIIFLFIFSNYFIFCQSNDLNKPDCDLDVSKNIEFAKYAIQHPEKLRELISKDSSFLSDYYFSKPFESRVYQKDKFNNFYDEYLYFYNQHFIEGFRVEKNVCKNYYNNKAGNDSVDLYHIIKIKPHYSQKISIIFDFIYNTKENKWKFQYIYIHNEDWIYWE